MASYQHDSVTPYGQTAGSKKQQVAQMFDNISARYDLLNHAFSLGIDVMWRRRAVKMLAAAKPQRILDIATGTGDFAVEAARILKPQEVIGIDISDGMLTIGRQKMAKQGLTNIVTMQLGDAEHLPFADNSFDAITVGFGVRNFENLERGLGEMHRVLKPGGTAIILEPAAPTVFPLKQLFRLYFYHVLPAIGRLASRDKSAYSYLQESVRHFPNGADFLAVCTRVGYRAVTFVPLTLGICSLYRIEK